MNCRARWALGMTTQKSAPPLLCLPTPDRMLHSFAFYLFLLATGTVLSTVVHAQTEDEFLFWTEEKLVVTATRRPIPLGKAPGAITVINDLQLET